MKKKFIKSFIAIIIISTIAFGQTKTTLQFNGLYTAKTGTIKIPNNPMDIFTYVRFYEDGTVYTQAVNSYDPQKVSEWLGKDGRFERKGTYKIDGTDITFTVSNNKSPDKKIEGAKVDKYEGKILANNTLQLKVTFDDGEVKDFIYEFAPVE
jgi:hypothetical protein